MRRGGWKQGEGGRQGQGQNTSRYKRNLEQTVLMPGGIDGGRERGRGRMEERVAETEPGGSLLRLKGLEVSQFACLRLFHPWTASVLPLMLTYTTLYCSNCTLLLGKFLTAGQSAAESHTQPP